LNREPILGAEQLPPGFTLGAVVVPGYVSEAFREKLRLLGAEELAMKPYGKPRTNLLDTYPPPKHRRQTGVWRKRARRLWRKLLRLAP
jgi:hypothetical protein